MCALTSLSYVEIALLFLIKKPVFSSTDSSGWLLFSVDMGANLGCQEIGGLWLRCFKTLGLHRPFEKYARGHVIQVLPHDISLLQIGPSGITAIVLIANLLTEKSNLIQDILQGEHFYLPVSVIPQNPWKILSAHTSQLFDQIVDCGHPCTLIITCCVKIKSRVQDP